MGWPSIRLELVLAGLGWFTVLHGWSIGQGTPESPLAAQHPTTRRVCIVVGAPGEPAYEPMFQSWSQEWKTVFQEHEVTWVKAPEPSDEGDRGQVEGVVDDVSVPGASAVARVGGNDREAVLGWVSTATQETDEHWLILIGHGTHDAKSTKFNLVGPDLSAEDLGQAMSGKPGKWIVLICASCSGPFLTKLAGPNRIVITATKSGAEQNFSRFGKYLAESSHDEASDLDHDQAISVLEMFLAASDRVARYYADRGLLATEQALIDDTGDGKGTPATFYRGVRAVKSAAGDESLDGELARRTVAWRNGLFDRGSSEDWEQTERELERLRGLKATMEPDAYYVALERLFRRLGRQQEGPVEPRIGQ
jgi:hypothetical protein